MHLVMLALLVYLENKASGAHSVIQLSVIIDGRVDAVLLVPTPDLYTD